MLATISATFAFAPAQPNLRDWATHGQISDAEATGLVLDDDASVFAGFSTLIRAHKPS